MKRAARAALLAAVCVATSQCTDTVGPRPPDNSIGVIVSGVIAPHSGAAGQQSASVLTTGFVYVSLSPNSVPAGVAAKVTNRASGVVVTTAMMNGGFDPVAIGANVGDTIDVDVSTTAPSDSARAQLVVAARSRPRIVRTNPPHGGRDVPLNTTIVVVFSEPIDSTTLTPGMALLVSDSVPVLGQVGLVDAQQLKAVFQPAGQLAPLTTYRVMLTQAIRNVSGLTLDSAALVSFTTGSAVAPILSSMSPSSIGTGSAGFTLTVTGSEFVPGSVVSFGGTTQVTTFVDSAHLTAAIPASAVASAGTVPVTVLNPAPDGGASDTLNFLVTSATPGLVFASVTEGDYYTCGVTTTGAAYCWGGLLFGPLDHRIIGTLTPVAVPGGHRFASVSAGQFQVCGVTTDGAAYCWGDLGMGDLTLDPATLSACNSKWDCPTPVPVPGGLTFASLSLGDLHRCGVTTNGAAYCWGNDPAAPDVTTPQPVPGGLTFAMVSAGGGLTCGVTTAGDAYCWGNAGGALGDGTTTGSTVPVKVAGGLTFKTVSGGDGHACGITTDGTTYCWGFNNWGALGDSTSTNSTVPVMVAGGHTFATISAQWYSTCAVTTAGAAYCWGADFTAAPGGVPGDLLPSSTPVRVPGGLTFATLSTGFVSHRCGVTTGGTAYCWGMNSDGELGNGTTTQSGVPVKVAGQP